MKKFFAVGLAAILSITLAPSASAEPISAVIGGSSATVNTPIYKPGEYQCSRIQYTAVLEADVNVATIAIVDGFGGSIASDVQTAPGNVGGTLQVCSFRLDDSQGPYTLLLEVGYTFASDKADQVANSAPFNFSSRGGATVTCKKLKKPRKGQVKKFKKEQCPRGWKAT